jgi:hypothetical protein
MSDTARVLLTAAVLSWSAFATFAWRVTRFDASQPERLIGELRLAQWAAVLLAATGAAGIGFAASHAMVPTGTVDATMAVACVVLAGFVLLREPRTGLLVAALGLLGHAIADVSHRPGWLSVDLVPRWYVVGCAIWDLAVAAVCLWARRR